MRSPFSIYKVFGKSMLPKLKPDDKVISFNWFIRPKVNDLVVAKVSGKEIIKRVHLIKDKEVFLKGDNEQESTDSRTYGFINSSQIIGKVIAIMKS